MVIDPVTGVIKRRSLTAALAVATTNTLVKNGLTVTSTVNGIAASITLPSDSSTASNGLNMVGYDTRLGGALTGATTITTTGANTLAVSGLQSGTVADSILVADATTGVMRRRSPANLLSNSTTNSLTIVGNTITSNVNGVSSSATMANDSTTASNGLNIVGKDVRMGGALTGATTITTTGANTLAVSGLHSGTVADSILVADATTGVMRRRSPEALLNATTTNIANSNGNIHTSTVNGITDTTTIINSNNLSYSGNTLTSNVNGVSSSVNLFLADSTTASNGLNMVGKDVRMGGALTGATTITTTGANTLAVSGLQSGTVADSILVADATTGVMRRRSPEALLNATTTNIANSNGNIHTSTVNGITDTATIINNNTVTITGNTITTNVNGVSSSATLSNDDSTTASNGLNMVGKDVRMGGALTGATTITTTGANTLAVSGLQSGTVADSILVADATTGVMRRRSPAALLNATTTNIASSTGNIHTSTVNGITDTTTIINNNTVTITGNTITTNVNGVSSSATLSNDDSTTASNGLNMVGKDVRMGGALTGATTITTTGANTLAVSGLQSGTVADSILVADATTGVLKRRAPASLLTNSTTNNLTIVGNTITSNVNGVSSSATLSNDDSTTASNGLNIVGKDVRMGGALTAATTITTTGANTLAVSGLQSGTGADSILVADATSGVMRRRSPSTILASATTNTLTSSANTMTSTVNGVVANAPTINTNVIVVTAPDTFQNVINGVASNKVSLAAAVREPWFDQATGAGATLNTQNIYQMGNVGIGNTAPNSKLQVSGSIALPYRKVVTNVIVDATDYTVLANCSTGNKIFTLPAPASCPNRIYIVGKTDATSNTLTFTEDLYYKEGLFLSSMNYPNTLIIQSDGTNWWILGRSNF
ncbi:MAG: hypothetical protein IPK03_11085 [Bacteroidetes bacterium]|nr:hypothetical protein [Bacteroidota bacterium]